MKRKIIAIILLIVLLSTNYVFADSGTAKKLNTIAKLVDEDNVIDRKFSAVTYLYSQDYENKDYTNIINLEQSDQPTYYSETQKFYIVEYDDGNDQNSYINRYVALKFKATETGVVNENSDMILFTYKDAIIYKNEKYDLLINVGGLVTNNVNDDYEILFQVGRYRKNTKEPLRFYPGAGTSASTGSVNISVTSHFMKDNQRVKISGIYKISDVDQRQQVSISNPIKDYANHRQQIRDGIPREDWQYVYKNSEILNNVYMNKNAETGEATDTIEYIDYGDEKEQKSLTIYSNTRENLKGNESDLYFTFEDVEVIGKSFQFNQKSAFSTYGFIDIRNYYSVDTNAINGTITETKEDLLKGDDFTVEYTPTDETYYLKRITVDGNDENLTNEIKNSYTFSNIAANHQIEVEYAKKFTVDFDSKGGTEVTKQLVIPSEKAIMPAEPTKEGYIFKGWYIDEEYTTLYDFDSPVNENKILYAKWEKSDVFHNITYVILGEPKDNNANNPDKYKEGDTDPLSIEEPTKEGYTFSGWYDNQELTGNPVTTINVTNRQEDITLYGKWEEKNANYKVNYYLEDETGEIEKDGKKYKLDKSETKSATINTTVTESPEIYVGYNAIDNSLSGVVKEDGSLELDFYYNKKVYNITFDSKGGTQVGKQTKKYGEKVVIPEEPTKEGYKFLNWYEEINGEKIVYDFNTPVTSDKTLIAEWEEVVPLDIYHDITYIVIGEPKDNNANNPDKYKEGDTNTLSIEEPTKEGYTFLGWYDNQELTGNRITTLDFTNRKENIVLYGKWVKNEPKNINYTINHYLEDENGIVTKGNKKYKLNNSETKEAPINTTVTENAQTFEGYEAENYTLNGIVKEDDNLELNFYYNKKEYNITFDSQGGTQVEDQTKMYGEKVTKPSDPTKNGYRFLYWYEEKDGKKVIYDFDKPVNSNKKLIAQWEQIKIIPDEPKKEDNTTAKTILPNTGITGTIIVFSSIMILGLFFGIRYFKLKKYIKQ